MLRESVSVKVASERTGIAESTLRQWIRDGRLEAWRVNGTRIRVYVDAIQALYHRA
jgi:excisionase family DNA binding protein